jgi:DNA-binding transcriptional MerR regulator
MDAMSIMQPTASHMTRSRSPAAVEFTTRQAAELAGVTVRAIRHYQQIGLLSEPTKTSRGSVYSAEHVLRLLRIRRLTAMGLTLEEAADTLANPASPKSTRILAELDRALADRAAEIQAQRRIVKELRDTHAPVDVLPEFARYAAALRRLAGTSARQADRLVTDLVADLSGHAHPDALEDLLNQVVDDPWSGRLADAEERLREVSPGSAEAVVSALAQDYGCLLVELYDSFIEGSAASFYWSGAEFSEEILANLVGTALNETQRDVLARAATVLAAHAAQDGVKATRPSAAVLNPA